VPSPTDVVPLCLGLFAGQDHAVNNVDHTVATVDVLHLYSSVVQQNGGVDRPAVECLNRVGPDDIVGTQICRHHVVLEDGLEFRSVLR